MRSIIDCAPDVFTVKSMDWLEIMTYNKCKTCGASNGRAGMLINDECENCHETRVRGEVWINAHLSRTNEELEKTMAILSNSDITGK